jgi:ABC-2 type transport system permease protein
MMLRPGSAPWLLRHELRMYYYSLGLGAKAKGPKRGLSKTGIGILAFMVLALHALAYLLVLAIKFPPGALPLKLLTIVTAIIGVVLTIMLSSALRASVEALFERGDLDMLLSSPLSSRSIFTVRLGGVVLGVASIYLLLLSPLAHMGVALGKWRWLGVYPTVLAMAVLMASLAMLFTLGLVKWLGVRKTRVVAQVIGAVSGAAIFIISQLFSHGAGNTSGKETLMLWFVAKIEHSKAFGADSQLWLPARALLGEPLPMLVLLLAGLAVFLFTVRFTHRFFVHGVQQAASMDRVATPKGPMRFTFGRALAHSIVVKEWRLIARDPQLVSQVLMQLLYLLPLAFMLFTRGSSAMPGIGAGMALLCSSLTGSLGWIIVCAEDAPDLLLSAPIRQSTVRNAKVAAMTVPPLALVALPILWTALAQPLAAAVMALVVGLAVASASAIVLMLGKPASRGDFRRRGKGNMMSNLAETFTSMAWAALAYLLLWLLTKPA